MLQKESVLTSYALASLFDKKDRVILPKSNTVLADLVRATTLPFIASPINDGTGQATPIDGELEYFSSQLEGLSSGSLEEPSIHNQISDAYIDDISKYVKNHISFAKNIANPVVMDYIERIKLAIANFKFPESSTSFDIQIADIPELLEDDSFLDTLRFYDEKAVISPDLIPSFGPRDNETLNALILLGDTDADQAIVSWLSRKHPNFLQEVWKSFFLDRKQVTDTYITYNELVRFDIFDKVDYALAGYLLTIKLFESVPEDVTGSLNSYQDTLVQTRNFMGAILADAVRKFNSFSVTKTLVTSFLPTEKGVIVYGNVYRKWLEEGGSPEVIFGLIISNQNIRLCSLIDENRENYLARWKTYETFFNANQGNAYYDFCKTVLTTEFTGIMTDFSAEENEFIQSNPEYLEVAKKLFEKELDLVKSKDLEDLTAVCVRLVCRSRFYYTDAEIILTDMLDASKVNPNIDAREAGLIAVANYIFDYLADQMQLVDNKVQ